MTHTIRQVDVAEQADIAARLTIETHERQPNPHERGSEHHAEWESRYTVALLRLSSQLEGCEGSA